MSSSIIYKCFIFQVSRALNRRAEFRDEALLERRIQWRDAHAAKLDIRAQVFHQKEQQRSNAEDRV